MIMKFALLLGYTAAALGMSMPTKDALPVRATTFSSVPVEPDSDGCDKLTEITSLTKLSDVVNVLQCEIDDGMKNNNQVCSDGKSASAGNVGPFANWIGWVATFTPPSAGNDTYSYGSTAVVHSFTRPLLREKISEDTLAGGFVAATWNPGPGFMPDFLKWACQANSTNDFLCPPYNQWGLMTIQSNGEQNLPEYTEQPIDCEQIKKQGGLNPYTQVIFTPSFDDLDMKMLTATWENQFKLMNETLPMVFPEDKFGDNPCANAICKADEGKHWSECPTLLDASTTWTNFSIPILNAFDSWQNAFDQDQYTDPEAEVTTALFGADVTDAMDAANKLHQLNVSTFYALGDKLCTNPLAVRTYLWVFMDSSALNFGTGTNWNGCTGPCEECEAPEGMVAETGACNDLIASANKKLDREDYGKTWAAIPQPAWVPQPDNRRRMGMGTQMEAEVLFFRTL